MKRVLILLFISSVFLSGCESHRPDEISIAGSSTVYPITLEAQAAYVQEIDREANISVESTGTGGGFDLFTEGQVDINDASRVITDEEKSKAQANNVSYSEYQIGTDGITVIINQDNDFASSLTREKLKKAFELGSDITYWSDIDSSFPEEKINFYGPTSASGTYDFFVEAILRDEDGALREDMNATENDNEIITNIEKDKYGIGFLGYSYYMSNSDNVQEVEVDGVLPNSENIKSGNYILARPLFIYVNNDSVKNNESLSNFVNYYIKNSQEFVELAGYVPLDDDEQLKLEKSLDN